jgi:hypothetical protein
MTIVYFNKIICKISSKFKILKFLKNKIIFKHNHNIFSEKQKLNIILKIYIILLIIYLQILKKSLPMMKLKK